MSYSRHDEALVKPLAGLLGVAADDAVFLDVSSLKPGQLWEEEIMGAVKEASVFVLCWCCESEHSTFVAKEIAAALSEGKKRLVPVLFCSAPLPPGMAGSQWIDLRGQVVHDCPVAHGQKKKQAPRDTPFDTGGPAPGPGPVFSPRPAPYSAPYSAPVSGPVPGPPPAGFPFQQGPQSPGSDYPDYLPSPPPMSRPTMSSPAMTAPAMSAPPQAAMPSRAKRPRWAGAIGFATVVAVGVLLYLRRDSSSPASFPGNLGPEPGRPAYLVPAVVTISLALLAYVVYVVAKKVQSLRLRREHRQADEIAARAKSYFENLAHR